MSAYQFPLVIPFKYCDMAGIVFYPRYVEILNDVVERWFEDGLGISFEAFHVQRQLATPVARLEVDFVRPSRLGEHAVFHLQVLKIGNSSMRLSIELRVNDERRLGAELSLVVVDMGSLRPTPIPADMRERMQAFLKTDAA